MRITLTTQSQASNEGVGIQQQHFKPVVCDSLRNGDDEVRTAATLRHSQLRYSRLGTLLEIAIHSLSRTNQIRGFEPKIGTKSDRDNHGLRQRIRRIDCV